MVYAVYLNPTIDKTVYIDSLRVGGTNRVGKVLSQGGGKAVNLAVTLHQMDVPVTVCGFLYKGNSRLIRQSLIGISTSLWEFPGEARVNTKIFDQQSGIVTEINESGPALSADILKQFEAVFLPQIKKEDLVVLTGSLPPGCPADYYAQLTEKLPCRVAVDADGETLARAVEKAPSSSSPTGMSFPCSPDFPWKPRLSSCPPGGIFWAGASLSARFPWGAGAHLSWTTPMLIAPCR